MAEKILIIDDDLDTLKLVGLMLRRQGYEIVEVSGGAQALEKAAAERPNLILLDVMMPDMDGHEVTRRLRTNPDLAQIPIIMFTAKALVSDKVAGFEAGADDYLTKPTHPAELAAHIKAALARSDSQSRETPAKGARMIGFLGAQGGVGTTTLAINIAVSLSRQGQEVILADVNSGRSGLGLQLGLDVPAGLTALLQRRPEEITPRLVEGHLVTHASGIRLLLASYQPADAVLLDARPQLDATVQALAALCNVLVLDLGSGLSLAMRQVVRRCDKVLLSVEPHRVSVALAQALVNELGALGLRPEQIKPVLVKRARSSLQFTTGKLQNLFNSKDLTVINAAPELAYQASEAGAPMVLLDPHSQTAGQFSRLAQQLLQNGLQAAMTTVPGGPTARKPTGSLIPG